MNFAKLFEAVSDEKFRLRAFADYCEDKKRAASAVIQAVAGAIEAVPDDPTDQQVSKFIARTSARLGNDPKLSSQSTLGTTLSNVAESAGVSPDGVILLDNGYTNIGDMLLFAQQHVTAVMNDEEPPELTLYDSSGIKTGLTATFEEITHTLNSTLHSVTVTAAAAASMAQDVVADRISVFNDLVQETFQNAYLDLSNAGSTFKEILRSAKTPADFFKSMASVFQADQLASGDIKFPEQTSFQQFSGASPLSAFSLDKVNNIVGTAVGAIVVGIGGLFKALSFVAKKAFAWVGKQINEVFVDPYDLVLSDGDVYGVNGIFAYDYPTRSGTITGVGTRAGVESTNKYLFPSQFCAHFTESQLRQYAGVESASDPNPIVTMANAIRQDIKGKVLYFRTIFGDAAIMVTDVIIDYSSPVAATLSTTEVGVDVTFRTSFRPFCVNRQKWLVAAQEAGAKVKKTVGFSVSGTGENRRYLLSTTSGWSIASSNSTMNAATDFNEQTPNNFFWRIDDEDVMADAVQRFLSSDGCYCNPKNVSEMECIQGFYTAYTLMLGIFQCALPAWMYANAGGSDRSTPFGKDTYSPFDAVVFPSLGQLQLSNAGKTYYDTQVWYPAVHSDATVTNYSFMKAACAGNTTPSQYSGGPGSQLQVSSLFDHQVTSSNGTVSSSPAFSFRLTDTYDFDYPDGGPYLSVPTWSNGKTTVGFNAGVLSSCAVISLGFIFAVFTQRMQRYASPTDYPFIPYRNDKESLPQGKYTIRTDEENTRRANNFMTAAIIVAIVVAVAITGVVVVKKISNAINMRRIQAQAALDSKMWSGEKLTRKEARRYRRLQKKLDASADVTGQLTSGASSIQDMVKSLSGSPQQAVSYIEQSDSADLLSDQLATVDNTTKVTAGGVAAVEATVIAIEAMQKVSDRRSEEQENRGQNNNGNW